MEKLASKWLEMHSQRHRLYKNSWDVPKNPLPTRGVGFNPLSYPSPSRRSVLSIGLSHIRIYVSSFLVSKLCPLEYFSKHSFTDHSS